MQNLQILANIGVSRVRMWRAGCLAEDSVQTVVRGGHADNGLEEQRLQNWGSASRYRDSVIHVSGLTFILLSYE